jgi:flagellar hook-length control protein FliK
MSTSAAASSVVVNPSAVALSLSGGGNPLATNFFSGQDLGELTAESLFASMMAGLLGTPSLATPAPAIGDAPLQFGGKGFNFDPSLLVVPNTDLSEGSFDISSFFSDLAPKNLAPKDQFADGKFSADLLKSLTAGVPQIPADQSSLPITASFYQNSDGTTTQTTSLADPLLVATGLSPTQMEELVSKLSALSAKATNENGENIPDQFAVISFTDSEIKSAEPLSTGKEVGTHLTPEFDPVEFQVAQKFPRAGAPLKPFEIASTSDQQVGNMPSGEEDTADSSPRSAHAIQGSLGQVGLEKSGQLGSQEDSLPFLIDPQSGLLTLPNAANGLPSPASGGQTALTNPLLHNFSAVQSHPAMQTVATLIQKTAKQGESQSLAIQLDPPELGRLNVRMQYDAGEPLKVHIVLEKADTMAMFLRDSHSLQSALDQAGLKTDSASLSFELSQDGSAFQQALGGGQNQSGSSSSGERWTPSSDQNIDLVQLPPIETVMDLSTDPKTGLTRYNLLV